MVDISRARLERSVDTNTGVVDSGAAQVYGTLSQRLHEFSNRQMKDYAQQRIAQGSKEGAQASAGKLTGPVPEGDTMYNQAYREAAIAGYAASIKTEVVGQRSMMEAQFSTDPEGFVSQFDGFSKGMLNGVDPELRPIVMQELALSRNSALARITSNKIEQDNKDAITDIGVGIQTTMEEAIKAASDLDSPMLEHNLAQLKTSLDLMVARGAKTSIEAADIQSDFLKEIDNAMTLGAFDNARKQGRGLEYLAAFLKHPPEDLLPEEVDKLGLRMETMLTRDIRVKSIQASQAQAVGSQERALRVSNLQVGVSRGQLDEVDIDAAFNQGDIKGSERTRLIKELDDVRKEQGDRQRRIGNIYDSIDGNIPIDPVKDKKAVSEAYVDMLSGLPEGASEQDVTDVTVEFVSKTGVMPQDLLVHFKQYSNPGMDDDTVAKYSNLYGSIREKNPKAIKGIPTADRAYWSSLDNLIGAGVPIEMARETAYKNAYDLTPNEKDAIKAEYKEGAFTKGNSLRFGDFVAEKYPQGIWERLTAGREPPPAMKADYNNMVKMFYQNTRSIDLARELAGEAIGNIWTAGEDSFSKETRIDSNPEVMRTPPAEKFDPKAPENYDPWNYEPSFSELIKSPEEAAEEGMAANLVRWLTGKTKEAEQIRKDRFQSDSILSSIGQQMSDLEEEGKHDSPEYNALAMQFDAAAAKEEVDAGMPSLSEIVDFAKENPKEFVAEFINALEADPILLATPLGWEKAAVTAGNVAMKLTTASKAISAARIAGGAAGAGSAGAGIGAGISIADQLGQANSVEGAKVFEDAKTGFVLGAVTGGIFKGAGLAAKGIMEEMKAAPEQIKRVMDQFKGKDVSVDDVRKAFEGEFLQLSSDKAGQKLIPGHIKLSREELNKYIEGMEIEKSDLAIERFMSEIMATNDTIHLGAPKPLARMFESDANLTPKALQEKAGFAAIEHGKLNAMEEAFLRASMNRQGGKINRNLLIGAGVVTGGIAVAPFIDEPGDIALIAAAGLAAKTLIKHRDGIAAAIKRIRETKPVDVTDAINSWEANVASDNLAAFRMMEKVKELVPDLNRRNALSHVMEKNGKAANAVEKEVVKQTKSELNKIFKIAEQEGVIESFIENYLPHLWRQGLRSRSDLLDALGGRGKGLLKTFTDRSKERKIATLKEGMDLGYEPITQDIAEILKIYTSDVMMAVRTRQLVTTLKAAVDVEGNKLVMPIGKAPEGYVTIDHPALKSTVVVDGEKVRVMSAVHPDIAPSLKFVFGAKDPNIIGRGLLALNFASKRSLVALSGFHMNALLESAIMSGINPVTAIPHALGMLRHGKPGDVVDIAVRAGLKLGVIEDLGPDAFYGALSDIRKVLNDIVPYAGTPITAIEKTSKLIDNIMWDKVATGAKLATFMKEYETAVLRNAEKHASNPVKYKLESKEVIAEQVATFVNDAYGGLNWRRIAESTRTRFGREVMLALYSPDSRKVMQLLMFAPDWTIANIRVLKNAITSPDKRIRNFHRKYAIRGALMYAIAGTAINSVFAGRFKPIWENERFDRIDMNDGREMVFSKQFSEPPHWVMDPAKTMANKMGVLPKEILSQMQSRDYFSSQYAPAMEDTSVTGRMQHAGKNFVPIFVQQLINSGPAAGMSGFLGHPIYGERVK